MLENMQMTSPLLRTDGCHMVLDPAIVVDAKWILCPYPQRADDNLSQVTSVVQQ